MKATGLLLIAALLFFSCNQSNSNKEITSSEKSKIADSDKPVIKFDKEVHNFGTIKEGEKIEYTYTFTNSGKTPLIISGATATCGCTVPEIPNKPINPGEKGNIKVIFNSSGKPGLNDKVITITSNAIPTQSKLHLIGEVKL